MPVETRQKLVARLTAERDPEVLGEYVITPHGRLLKEERAWFETKFGT